MQTFKEHYYQENDQCFLSYSQYCRDLDRLIALHVSCNGDLSQLHESSLKAISAPVMGIYNIINKHFSDAGKNFNFSYKHILRGLKTKNIYGFLRYFSFSLRRILFALEDLTGIISDSLRSGFRALGKIEKIRDRKQRARKIDDVLNQYPVLKKLTGPIVAVMLFFIWMNMAFTGSIKDDFDLTSMFSALVGKYSIETLFLSAQGMSMLSLLAVGLATGGVVSFVWVGSSLGNLTLALVYVALRNVGRAITGVVELGEYIKRKVAARRDVSESFVVMT